MTKSTEKSTTEIKSLIKSILEKDELKFTKKYEYQEIIKTVFTALKPLKLNPIDVVNALEPFIDFQTLTSDIALQPLIVRITDLYDNIDHFDTYGEFLTKKYTRTQRNINISKNRVRLSFKALNNKSEVVTVPVEFGRIYSASGKPYHETEVSALVKNSKFDRFKDLIIGFDLNYVGFQAFIKKMIIVILSGINLTDEKKKELYPYKSYIANYESQIKNLIPSETKIYSDIREYIYNESISASIDIACNIATNYYRKSGDLNEESFDVSEQKYGSLFLVEQFLQHSGIYELLLESGLSLREISFICELTARTILEEYRVKTLSIEDKSNFSLSGLSSLSNATKFADKLAKYNIYPQIEQKLTQFFLESAISSGEKINVLFDSSIVFGDGKNIYQIKKTYSNTKGFGRGIKAIFLLTESGIPLQFNLESGNVTDITTVTSVMERLELFANIPREQLTIVCDAGYFSKENMLYLRVKGYDINIVGKGCNLSNEIIDSFSYSDRLVPSYYDGKNSYNEREVPLTKYISLKEMIKFQEENPELNVDIDKLSKQNLKLVVIYNLDIYQEDFKKTQRKIARLRKIFRTQPDKRQKLAKHPYVKQGLFSIVTDQYGCQQLVANVEEIERKAKRLGCNVIYSSLTKYSCEQIVQVYHSRINVELAFKMCKQRLGLDAIRVHSEQSLQLKMLVIQISVAFKNMLQQKLLSSEEVDEASGVSIEDKIKLMDEYPNVFNIVKYIHHDLSVIYTNGIVQYKNINKTSRIVLELLGYSNPEKVKFIQNSVSYKIKQKRK